jgi:hypothetical protein
VHAPRLPGVTTAGGACFPGGDQDGVVDRDLHAVGGAGRPGTGLADLDRPLLIQQRRDLLGQVEQVGHRRTSHAGSQIRRVMADHQQRPADRDGRH